MPDEPTSAEMPRITSTDFMTAIVAGLRLRNLTEFGYAPDAWVKASVLAFAELKEADDTERIDCRFTIKQHPIHGDSVTAAEDIASLQVTRTISLQGLSYGTMRLDFDGDHAQEIIAWCGLPADLQEVIVDRFYRSYFLGS